LQINADFLILCGGLGTRLRTVTGETPKVMAEVQGGPFLDFLIRYLAKQGARRVILCAGYKAESLQAHYQKKFKDIELAFSIEREPLGTGGAFKNAENLVKSDLVFGLNGDCFTPVKYRDLLAFHQVKKSITTLVGIRIEGNKDFGTIVMNQRDEIVAFKEKFETREVQYISAGVYCFHRSVFGLMPAGKFSIEYDLFPNLIGKSFFGYKVDAPFIDIGTPERFEWAKKHLAEMLE
jgi:D-glycero-alpha-D-manno-heptose 1-phosphate guanylyltransferase